MSLENRGSERPLPRPIPERIKEARESRGFTLQSFADALCITPQAVAQYETGQIVPSGEVMGRIVTETALPLPFFTTLPQRAGELGRPFWRSLKRMDQPQRRRILRRLQWAGDIVGLVERFVDLPKANLPQIDFDDQSDEEEQIEKIEKAAESLRDFWELGRGPVRNFGSVLEANGVLILREKVSCADMSAVSCWMSGRPFILLSEEVESGPRDLFNLAHEVGHLILHASVGVTSKNIDRIEKEANRFSGAFLLPRESFSREVLRNSIAYFMTLKKRWGVEIAAMACRSKDLEILSDNQFSYLFRQMNYKRIRNFEPFDDIFPVTRPTILVEAIRMLIEHGVQTRSQIEDFLGLNMRDVESLCGVEPGYLDTRVVRVEFKRK